MFPLNTVLLPGAPLTLHIFEERYRLMIGRCLEQNTPFGVVLIREGDEVEEGRIGARAAVSHEIGTLAHINGSRQLDDGRYLISAVGQRRFRLQYVLQRTPYLTASVALLPEESVADVVEQAKELRTLYERFGQAIVAATGVQAEIEDLPPDIVTMSYHLAHRLDVTNEMKQRWLEADVATRLREISALLRSELALLPQNLRTRSTDSWDGLASLN
ncbi:MAG: LON peptidase substrate-binding domain-containing protein [Chloroflexaceae bacterium]|nr:LON peptidase substrate-binding domain-containing protein [Chloroflexaceae bacterium]